MCMCAHPYGKIGRCGFGGQGVTLPNRLYVLIQPEGDKLNVR
jgi:hypothetical protein